MYAYTAFTLGYFLQDHTFIFIAAIITFAISIMLRAKRIFLLQVLLFAATIATSIYLQDLSGAIFANIIYYALFVFQIVLGLLCVYKWKMAADYFYQLVLEKTHQTRPKYTKNGPGTRSSFF